MTRRLLAFVAGCVGFWLLALGPAWLLGGELAVRNATIAIALCGLPALASLALALRFAGPDPEKIAGALLGGMGVRMVTVLGGAVLLVRLFPGLSAGGDLAFWGWVILFYLFTLAW